MFEKLFLQAKDLLFCILNWDYCGRKAFFAFHALDGHSLHYILLLFGILCISGWV